MGGIDPENPESMNKQLQQYVSDICSTTLDAIGEENILPPLAELAEEPPTCELLFFPSHVRTSEHVHMTNMNKKPSLTPPLSFIKSASPSFALPAIESPMGVGDINAESAGGLSGGAIAGIVIAGAAVTTLLLYLMAPKRLRDEETNEDDDLAQMDQTNTEKEMAAIISDESDNQERSDSSTADLTINDSGSLSTKGSGSSKTTMMSNYYAKNSLLPVQLDEESLSTNDTTNLFALDESAEMHASSEYTSSNLPP